MTREEKHLTIAGFMLVGLMTFGMIWIHHLYARSIEEQSIYHIYDKLEIYRVVHEAYPVVIITTKAYRLKNGTRELILYRQDTCEPNKVDSIKYEHSKKINEQINKVLNESL